MKLQNKKALMDIGLERTLECGCARYLEISLAAGLLGGARHLASVRARQKRRRGCQVVHPGNWAP